MTFCSPNMKNKGHRTQNTEHRPNMHNFRNMQIWKDAMDLAQNIYEIAEEILSIALGSLFELNTQIILAERIGYIDNIQSLALQGKADKLQMMISGFKRRMEEENNEPITV